MNTESVQPPAGPVPALLRRLLDDHRELLPALQQWADALPGTEPAAARAQLAALAQRLRAHARLEDETLFVAMAEELGRAALTGYQMQHDDIDEVLERLLAVPGALPPDAADLAGRLLWYCESHFETEEKYLFQEALRRLTPSRWEALWLHASRLPGPGSLSNAGDLRRHARNPGL